MSEPRRSAQEIAAEYFPDQYWCNKCGTISVAKRHNRTVAGSSVECDYYGFPVDLSATRRRVEQAIESDRKQWDQELSELRAERDRLREALLSLRSWFITMRRCDPDPKRYDAIGAQVEAALATEAPAEQTK